MWAWARAYAGMFYIGITGSQCVQANGRQNMWHEPGSVTKQAKVLKFPYLFSYVGLPHFLFEPTFINIFTYVGKASPLIQCHETKQIAKCKGVS